jgi:uncharacterized protein with HEPN domain
MSRDPATLADMLRACSLILEFRKDLTLDMFLVNAEKQSAILHQLLLLGEATKRLSTDFRDAHPNIVWADIAGMRDRLIHGYDVVELPLVWDVIQKRVPSLLAYLQPLISNFQE